ncbi:MAG: HlyC/CorC family transporter [Candidatus Omnitrophota bacterium]|jgi:CBS domain containing-hemolysin-like protein|nr:MAG: HlyC/CorC family transporter [Candidatus Omnitrophota bacterium]
MLFTLLVVILVSLTVSFVCSLMEAALFTLPLSAAQSMADQYKQRGHILVRFKKDIGYPISAILILNTVAHTIGAAISGALVDKLYGEPALVWFSIVFTFLILYLSEIIPKQIGAVYYKPVSLWFAVPLALLIKLFYPLILTTNWVSKLVKRGTNEPMISEQEILSMTKIGSEEGVLDILESAVIRNIVLLDRITVKQALTPRAVVFKLAENTVLQDIRNSIGEWNHTRIPLYSPTSPDTITGYVNQRDLLRELIRDSSTKTVNEFKRPLKTVPESMPMDRLFANLIESREPIRSVVDEYGVFAGIVTMEDVIEEIVGKEIVDEYDIVRDLRAYARALYSKRIKQQ